MDVMRARQPFFGSLPPVVVLLTCAIALVSGAALVIGPWANEALVSAVAVVSGPMPPFRPLGEAAPLVLHVFAHGGWLHLILNLVALLAFGTAVARRFGHGLAGSVSFLAVFFIAGMAGALAELAYQQAFGPPGVSVLIVGASTGVSGLVAGAVYVLRGGYYRELPKTWSPRYWAPLTPWVIANVLIGLTGFMAPEGGGVAWMGHLGGLIAGAVCFPLIDAYAQRHRPFFP